MRQLANVYRMFSVAYYSDHAVAWTTWRRPNRPSPHDVSARIRTPKCSQSVYVAPGTLAAWHEEQSKIVIVIRTVALTNASSPLMKSNLILVRHAERVYLLLNYHIISTYCDFPDYRVFPRRNLIQQWTLVCAGRPGALQRRPTALTHSSRRLV
jgi:hypothetical protein